MLVRNIFFIYQLIFFRFEISIMASFVFKNFLERNFIFFQNAQKGINLDDLARKTIQSNIKLTVFENFKNNQFFWGFLKKLKNFLKTDTPWTFFLAEQSINMGGGLFKLIIEVLILYVKVKNKYFYHITFLRVHFTLKNFMWNFFFMRKQA
jgi:hypothetical protein